MDIIDDWGLLLPGYVEWLIQIVMYLTDIYLKKAR